MMGRSSYKPTNRSPGDLLETTPLLSRPPNTRSARQRSRTDHCQHQQQSRSTGRFYTHPSGQTTLRLRLRQEYFGPVEERPTPAKKLDWNHRAQVQQGQAREQIRQDWLRRLRPKPHRQCSPAKRGGGNRRV
jgi:hypothetical protein